jgi:ribonuclease P protein component
MRRAQRLRANADFRRVRGAGRAWSHPLLVLLVAPGPDPAALSRVGVSAARRVGNAVIRNRAKRRVREAVRARYPDLPDGWDLVWILRPGAASASFAALAAAVELLLRRAGLLPART